MALINKLNEIGDSIREATGKTDLFTLEEMADEIVALGEERDELQELVDNPPLEELSITENGEYLPSEGKVGFSKVSANVKADVSDALPPEVFIVTGNCKNRFSQDGWNWYLDMWGDKIITKDIISCPNMFDTARKLTNIPFNINVTKKCLDYSTMFGSCEALTAVPLVIPQEEIPPPATTYSGYINMSNVFMGCFNLREIPYDWFNNIISEAHFEAAKELTNGTKNGLFYNCNSLRKHPDITRTLIKNNSAYSSNYYNLFNGCYALDEINSLPVIRANCTSNLFANTFKDCFRFKDFIFETNVDGSAIVVNWKSQTLDFSSLLTNATDVRITAYNSGITKDKKVTDDASYQALKSDPDWYTFNYDYCRYNHDSAVNTINSLPDVSAGSGNTIKFKGSAGTKTDGGAINTMTEVEIAVAAAKGWTVSFV